MSIEAMMKNGRSEAYTEIKSIAQSKQESLISRILSSFVPIGILSVQIILSMAYVSFFAANPWASVLMIVSGLAIIAGLVITKTETKVQREHTWDLGTTLLLLANNSILFGILMLFAQIYI